jgi:hypothetical protein
MAHEARVYIYENKNAHEQHRWHMRKYINLMKTVWREASWMEDGRLTWAKSMLRTGISENCLCLESSFSVLEETLRARSQKDTPSFTACAWGMPAT